MAVVKLTPQQLASLRSKPKLSPFWQSYFNDINVELNKLFFHLFREQVQVKPVHLALEDAEDYLNNSVSTITQFF